MNETSENAAKDSLLLKLGSTWTFDAVYLFVFPPLGALSIAANLISYRVFSKKCFNKKPLYTYLRTICLNSSLISFMFSISFVCDSKRFLSLSNTYMAAWFRCMVKIPVLSTAYFNGCLLDIILALERLCQLTDQKEKFNRIPAAKLSALVFFLCFLLNLPYFFVFEVKKVYYTSEQSSVGFFYHYGESKFALGTTGTVVKNVNYFIRDILTLVVLIVLNILTLIKLKRNIFLHQNQLTNIETQRVKSTLLHSSSSSSTLAMMMIMTSSSKNTPATSRNNNIRTSSSHNANACLLVDQQIRKNLVVSVCYEANKMITKMVLIICFLSTLEHLFLIVSLQLFSVAYFKPVKWNFIFLSNVTMLSRHSVNFLLFYSYNGMFRKRFFK